MQTIRTKKSYFIENQIVPKNAKITILDENLSYNQIVNKLFYTGDNNWHLQKFYDLRKQYNGRDTKNVHLIATQISDIGYCDILLAVDATKDGTPKKELKGDDGELRDNFSNEYAVIIRINDFWDMIDEFNMISKNDFRQEDLVALIQLSQDIKISDSTPSFWWMGTSYYLTQDNASLMPCSIPPKFWNHFRPNVKVSKTLEVVFRNLGFLTQQIAQSIKHNLLLQGYII